MLVMSIEVGNIVEGKVTGITDFGAFVELEKGKTGLVHISEVAHSYVKDVNSHLKVDDTVKVKVISVGDDGKIGLSIKRLQDPPQRQQPQRRPSKLSFEDKLARFFKESDEKQQELSEERQVNKKKSQGRR